MSKALQKAAIVVGAIALVATGVGALAGAGVFGTGVGAASVQAVAFTVGKYAAFAAAGLSAAGALLAPKPTFDTASSGIEWRADPYAGLPYAMGETAVGGQIVYRRTDDAWAGGDENDLQTIVTVLSCAGPIESIDGVDIERTATTFNSSTGAASGALADYVWWKGQLGATPESAQLNIVAGSSSAPGGWTSAHKLSGLAADMIRLRYDSKGDRFGLGEPQKRVRGRWVRVYDPRLDSTYPGGSGACRPFNETTYVWSRNPHLHALTWAMGRYSNGKLVAGLGLPLGSILVDQFIEGANICDANGWYLDGVIFTRPQTAWNNLKLILASAAAGPYITGGRVGCRNQTPRVAVGSITAADLRGEASRPATRPRRERKNIAFYRFRSVDNEYEVIDAGAPVRIADYVTADGDEERPMSAEFPLVQDVTQAAVLAAYEIAESREAEPLTYSVGPRFYNFKPGDCITDDTPEGAGLLLRIEQRAMDPESQIVTLICRTETTSKHARALAIGGTAPATITPPAVPASPAAPGVSAWSATGTAISDTGGAIPALVISGAADNAAATEILFWYRPTGGDGIWRAAGSAMPTATRHEITAVTPGTQYDVAISYRVRGQIGARRVLGPVTAGSPVLVWANVAGTGRPQDNATNTAPNAANMVPFSQFERVDAWVIRDNSGSVPVIGLAPSTVSQRVQLAGIVDFAASGQVVSIGHSPRFPVTPGQWLAASAQVEAVGTAEGTWSLALFLWDSDTTGAAFVVDSGTGAITIAGTRQGGIVQVPTGYLEGEIRVYAQSGSSGALSFGLAEPMVSAAVAGQTLLPPFTRGSNADSGADVTSDAVPILVLPPTTIIRADSAGTPDTGQLPRTLQVRVFKGGTDVTTSTPLALSISPSGNASATIHATSGVITITAMAGRSAILTVTPTLAGLAAGSFLVERQDAPPPVSGSGGGGAASTSSLSSFDGSSYVAVATLTVSTGSAGTIDLAAPLDIGTSDVGGPFPVYGKSQRWNGSSWVDVSSEVSGASTITDGEPSSITITGSATGLAANTAIDVRLVMRTSTTGRTVNPSGTFSATGS